MTPGEFIALAESIYGVGWRKPLSREIKRVPKQVRNYADGTTPIPQQIADQLRKLAHIGAEGEIVKKTVKKHIPQVRPYVAHCIAADAAGQIKKLTQRR